MKTRSLRWIGLFAALLGAACSEGAAGEDGAEGPEGPAGDEGPAGPAGLAGEPCTVDEEDGVVTITCADGTTATLTRGTDGEDGADGADGEDGADGADGEDGRNGDAGVDGEDGTSCSVTDNGDGTKTIACTDGTSVVVSDGSDGNEGPVGPTCISTDNMDGTWSVTCSDGSGQVVTPGSVTLEPVADGHTGAHSTSELLVDRSNSRVYLRFDLSGLPSGAVITSARLTMTAFTGFAHGGNGNVYTRLVTDDTWDETALNGAEPVAEEENLGFWWLWYDFSDFRIQVGTMQTNALRLAVQAEADGDDLISLRLHSSGYRTNYRPREWATADERPKLELTYYH